MAELSIALPVKISFFPERLERKHSLPEKKPGIPSIFLTIKSQAFIVERSTLPSLAVKEDTERLGFPSDIETDMPPVEVEPKAQVYRLLFGEAKRKPP